MKKLTELFKEKKLTFSFELFPPKTEQGYYRLLETIGQLAGLKPDFISVTYGAGGGSREKTLDIVEHIEKKHHIIGVAHLTCVCHTKDEIKKIIAEIKNKEIRNILALRGDPPKARLAIPGGPPKARLAIPGGPPKARLAIPGGPPKARLAIPGDPPKDNPDWQPGRNNFKYSSELCAFIRKHFDDDFGIGVAGFPEGHVLCPDREQDARYLRMKIDAGADYVITQLFFDNKDYFEYVGRLRKLGVAARIIPGIIPITDYSGIVNFCKICGASIPRKVHEIFSPLADNKEATLQEGIQFAVRQCKELLDGGAPGLHFYTLNKVSPTDTILSQVRR